MITRKKNAGFINVEPMIILSIIIIVAIIIISNVIPVYEDFREKGESVIGSLWLSLYPLLALVFGYIMLASVLNLPITFFHKAYKSRSPRFETFWSAYLELWGETITDLLWLIVIIVLLLILLFALWNYIIYPIIQRIF